MQKRRAPQTQQKIAEGIRERISRGELKPGDRLPSYSEMLNVHGVAAVTVDRVYSQLEYEGLIERRHGSGTYVRQPAKALRRVIGVNGGPAINAFSHLYFVHLLKGIYAEAQQSGFEILLLNSQLQIAWEKMDGILNVDKLYNRPPLMPCVSVIHPTQDATNVLADEESGMAQAVEHLIALGHHRIALLLDPKGAMYPRRLAGYSKALAAHGIKPKKTWLRDVHYTRDAFYRGGGEAAIRRWLEEDWHNLGCTALITQNDDTAIGAMAAFSEAGVEVPHEVSIIGFDGIEVGELVRPRLTSIAVPLAEMSALAFRLLVEQIEAGQSTLQTVVLPTHLEVRESTGLISRG